MIQVRYRVEFRIRRPMTSWQMSESGVPNQAGYTTNKAEMWMSMSVYSMHRWGVRSESLEVVASSSQHSQHACWGPLTDRQRGKGRAPFCCIAGDLRPARGHN